MIEFLQLIANTPVISALLNALGWVVAFIIEILPNIEIPQLNNAIDFLGRMMSMFEFLIPWYTMLTIFILVLFYEFIRLIIKMIVFFWNAIKP